MNITAEELRSMSRRELDQVFRSSPAGPVPDGAARGTALIAPGTFLDPPLRGLIRLLFWRGKRFRSHGRGSSLKNLIGPFSTELFRAEVYTDASWFAEGQAVILDYSESSFLVRMIRDEIRLVDEGLYLGQVYWGKRRLALFMLEFPRAVEDRAAPGEADSTPPQA